MTEEEFNELLQKANNNDAKAQSYLGKCYSEGLFVDIDYNKALFWLNKALEQDECEAYNRLGVMYYYGFGVEKNENKSVELYKIAISKGSNVAKANLGISYLLGSGNLTKDQNKAFNLFLDSANNNCPIGIFQLALCYLYGRGVEKDSSLASKYLQDASNLNYGPANYKIGVMYEEENLYKQAFEYFIKNKDDYKACQYKVGYYYKYGLITKQDYQKANEYLIKACKQNFALAIYELANSYEFGYGVDIDYNKTIELYSKIKDTDLDACIDLGYCYAEHLHDYQKALEIFYSIQDQPEAEFFIAECYFYGNGVSKDYSKAIEWYTKAANQNYHKALCNLGYCYEHGYGVNKDINKAYEYYLSAAEKGNPIAQYNMGNYYSTGDHIDYKKATRWYKLANEQDYYPATYNLGVFFEQGLFVKQNYKNAFKLFAKVVNNTNNLYARYKIGLFYKNGYYVEKDYNEAIYWFNKSISLPYSLIELGECYELGLGVETDLNKALEYYQEAIKKDQSLEKEIRLRINDIEKLLNSVSKNIS